MARDWCFTSYDTKELLKFDKDNCRYIIYGREKCPTTGREHYQGFAIFNRTCRMPKAKLWIGDNGAHLESRRGTRDEARDYCRKDGDLVEWGQYDGVTKEELFKKPIPWIKEHYPEFYCRYHRGLEKLQANKGEKWRKVDVTILWGETGTGKTRQVMEMDDVYKIDPPYTWWDGYEGESILLIDDFKIGNIPRGMFLNLLDGYRLRLETKGGHAWALWSHVFITCNKNPATWDDAILRRVTDIKNVTL